MGSLQCTRVSAELKTARSIVRLTEIQATLQEQRYNIYIYIYIHSYFFTIKIVQNNKIKSKIKIIKLISFFLIL